MGTSKITGHDMVIRDVPFQLDAICDLCGCDGAYDFMGDFICQGCLDLKAEDEENSNTEEK